ncbi:hypothetical protein FNF29_03241 [Cafeteria roenbergensis]|uniref:Rab-GAP TBC domain-containing protein n=1 Tax=Cafeteria roenbergensis TaxID=33653 RepID=A0A5A8CLU0_CAFRO|nr:hypothetical protein FNF29_03241 [Cafeteria roenbergensis]|eukprot:KAA0153424.1 hypothetical protein FNF29_03241 [Cafeteria roenbergensis]
MHGNRHAWVGHSGSRPTAAAFGPTLGARDELYLGCADGAVRVFGLGSPDDHAERGPPAAHSSSRAGIGPGAAPLAVLRAHRAAVQRVVASPDGSLLLTVSAERAIIWETATWTRRRTLRAGAAIVDAAFASVVGRLGPSPSSSAASVAGRSVLVAGFRDDSVVVWLGDTLSPVAKLTVPPKEASTGSVLSSVDAIVTVGSPDGGEAVEAGLLAGHEARACPPWTALVAAGTRTGSVLVWTVSPGAAALRSIVDMPASAAAVVKVMLLPRAAPGAGGRGLHPGSLWGVRLAVLDDAGTVRVLARDGSAWRALAEVAGGAAPVVDVAVRWAGAGLLGDSLEGGSLLCGEEEHGQAEGRGIASSSRRRSRPGLGARSASPSRSATETSSGSGPSSAFLGDGGRDRDIHGSGEHTRGAPVGRFTGDSESKSDGASLDVVDMEVGQEGARRQTERTQGPRRRHGATSADRRRSGGSEASGGFEGGSDQSYGEGYDEGEAEEEAGWAGVPSRVEVLVCLRSDGTAEVFELSSALRWRRRVQLRAAGLASGEGRRVEALMAKGGALRIGRAGRMRERAEAERAQAEADGRARQEAVAARGAAEGGMPGVPRPVRAYDGWGAAEGAVPDVPDPARIHGGNVFADPPAAGWSDRLVLTGRQPPSSAHPALATALADAASLAMPLDGDGGPQSAPFGRSGRRAWPPAHPRSANPNAPSGAGAERAARGGGGLSTATRQRLAKRRVAAVAAVAGASPDRAAEGFAGSFSRGQVPAVHQLAAMATGGSAVTDASLRALLQRGGGAFPDDQRLLAWRFLLRLPGNARAFHDLRSAGQHPAFDDLGDRFPMRSRRLLSALQDTVSVLAHWCPALADAPWLPNFVFPFVKLTTSGSPAPALVRCELCIAMVLNFAATFLQAFPMAPVQTLGAAEAALRTCDPRLADHLAMLGVTPERWAWPLLRSAFSEALPRSRWVPEVCALLRQHLPTDMGALERLIQETWQRVPADVWAVASPGNASRLWPGIAGGSDPDGAADCQGAPGGAGGSAAGSGAGDEGGPAVWMPQADVYPSLGRFPAFSVDFQLKERERIRRAFEAEERRFAAAEAADAEAMAAAARGRAAADAAAVAVAVEERRSREAAAERAQAEAEERAREQGAQHRRTAALAALEAGAMDTEAAGLAASEHRLGVAYAQARGVLDAAREGPGASGVAWVADHSDSLDGYAGVDGEEDGGEFEDAPADGAAVGDGRSGRPEGDGSAEGGRAAAWRLATGRMGVDNPMPLELAGVLSSRLDRGRGSAAGRRPWRP